MAASRGRADVRRYMDQLPDRLREGVLRGAARAAGKVIAAEAKLLCASAEVAEHVVIRSRLRGDRVGVLVTVQGRWARSIAGWLEWGTDPHLITVSDKQSQGRTAARINKTGGAEALKIGDKFIDGTIFHPGAQPNPFLRRALDNEEGAAIDAAQGYINARIAGRRGADGEGEQ